MLITDSVCLRVLDAHHLLVAVGNSLHHYHQPKGDPSSPAQCAVLADLLSEHIHGILSVPLPDGQHNIVAYGGRELVQLRLRNGQLIREIASRTVRLNDWISSGVLLANGSELVLLTCHGVAVRMALNWPAEGKQGPKALIVSTVKCPDKSTLYCSRIICNTERMADADWSGLTFLGGTAFGELIVWENADRGARVVQRVFCHNGVIFSIDCDPQQRLITTTSDDRSVKVWQLSNTDCAFWSITLMRTLFAHTGRVFRSRLLSDGHLLSAGEDGQLCLWQALTGELLARQPFGSALWHIDYEPGAQMAFVATSAGHCEQFCLKAYLSPGGRDGQVDDYGEAAMDSLQLPAGEHVVKVRFVHSQEADRPHIVAVTNRNRIVTGHPDREWNFCDNIPFKISLLEAHGCLVAVAGYKWSRIYEYNGGGCTLLELEHNELLDDMVKTVRFIDESEYLMGDVLGNAALMKLKNSPSRFFRMPPCKEPWATAVCRPSADLLIVGDRCGHLHLFDTSSDSINLCQTLRNVHGRLGCTTLNVERPSLILCSGHDGTLKRIELDTAGQQMSEGRTYPEMRLAHTLTVPMAWVQTVDMTSGLVLGFDADRCVVWQRHSGQTLARFECGGGHRYADVHIGDRGGEFVYLRRNEMRWLRFPKTLRKRFVLPAANRWHSLSCTVLEVCPLADGRSLIVSGGDDNILKFHLLHVDGTMRHLEDVCTHVSSIKSLLVHRLTDGGPTLAWRVISAGGRAQICITEVRLRDDETTTTTPVAQLHVQEIAQFMLHLSDVERLRSGTANTVDASAEARFMSVASLSDEGSRQRANNICTHFVAGCSDGMLRCFEISAGGCLSVIHSSSYGKCILKVLAIQLPGTKDSRCIVTAATDGMICFWRWKRDSKAPLDGAPFAEVRHHRSGVQSMDCVRQTTTDGFVLVTGGDDQSVVVSTFRLTGDQLAIGHTQRLEAMHTAQVNGVCFVDERRLYTTGVDQTVVRWEQRPNNEWLPTRLDVRTAVADVKGVQVWRRSEDDARVHENVLVYGYGVQVLDSIVPLVSSLYTP